MGKRPWVRFYHMDWAASGTVQKLTMEEVGVYWTLLVRQMVDGYVDMDIDGLKRLFNVKSDEEVDRLLSKRVMAKFNFLPEDKTKMLNHRLADVIEETDSASFRNKENVNKRYELKPSPLKSSSSSDSEPTPTFDFSPILNDYPPNKGGLTEGLKLMSDTITTEEEYQRLWAAVKAYKRERAQERDPNDRKKFTMGLGRFMTCWNGYVPKNFSFKPVDNTAPVTPPTRAPGEKPPWQPGTYDTEDVKQELNQYWTEDRKKMWLEGNDPRKQESN
jgi:hypothetical protein